MLDAFNKILEGSYQELNGIKYTKLDYGLAVGEMEIKGHHLNPNGTIHGGVLVTLADSVAMAGMIYTYEMNPATTTSLSISYLRTAKKGKVQAEAKILSKGKYVSAWQVECWDQEKNLLAVLQVSFCLLAKGSTQWEDHIKVKID